MPRDSPPNLEGQFSVRSRAKETQVSTDRGKLSIQLPPDPAARALKCLRTWTMLESMNFGLLKIIQRRIFKLVVPNHSLVAKSNILKAKKE